MKKIPADNSCIAALKPDFTHVLYTTSVDVVGKHLSGILLIKKMPDSSTRIVFTSETGLGFFDLGFGKDSGFQVYQVIPQMNKKAVIKTLRNDFELILFKHIDPKHSFSLKASGEIYHGFPWNNGVNFYITDSSCSHLMRMQRASKKKPVMEAYLFYKKGENTPGSMTIRHLNFNFTISLQKMDPLAAE